MCRLSNRALALVLALTSIQVGAQESASPPAELPAAAQTEPTASTASVLETTTPLPVPGAPPGTGNSVDFRSKVYEYRSAGSELHKPRGEITVTADHTEWQQAGVTRCTGNVRLAADTMEMRGDLLELKQSEDGRLAQAHVTGEPAQLTDAGAEGGPPITAHAKKLDYDAKTNLVELSGGAVLTRGADKLTGENIRYDVASRRVQASGGNSGQVKIVIQPADKK